METSLYKISFKNGRVFNVFCANRKQNKDMLGMLFRMQHKIKRGGQEVVSVGITTMKQFKEWEKILTNE